MDIFVLLHITAFLSKRQVFLRNACMLEAQEFLCKELAMRPLHVPSCSLKLSTQVSHSSHYMALCTLLLCAVPSPQCLDHLSLSSDRVRAMFEERSSGFAVNHTSVFMGNFFY